MIEKYIEMIDNLYNVFLKEIEDSIQKEYHSEYHYTECTNLLNKFPYSIRTKVFKLVRKKVLKVFSKTKIRLSERDYIWIDVSKELERRIEQALDEATKRDKEQKKDQSKKGWLSLFTKDE